MPYSSLEPVPAPTYDAVPDFKTPLSSQNRGWRGLHVYRYDLAAQLEPRQFHPVSEPPGHVSGCFQTLFRKLALAALGK